MKNNYGAVSTSVLDNETYNMIKKYEDKGLILLEFKTANGESIKVKNKFVKFREIHKEGKFYKIIIFKYLNMSNDLKNKLDNVVKGSENFSYIIE